MAEPYVGQIIMFAGNFAIQGFANCDGQLMPISQNTALFSILGTTYGGDGTTTFGLPDLRGRIPMHPGQGPGLANHSQGQSGGGTDITLTPDQLPPHSHSFALPCDNTAGNTEDPANAYISILPSKPLQFNDTKNDVMAEAITNTDGGAGGSFSVQNPFLAIRFLISLQGTYPSRN